MTSVALGLRGIRARDVSFLPAPLQGTTTSPTGEQVLQVDVARMRALGDAVRTDRLTVAGP
jgi:hypothetical protein